jgi:hypothetical protein
MVALHLEVRLSACLNVDFCVAVSHGSNCCLVAKLSRKDQQEAKSELQEGWHMTAMYMILEAGFSIKRRRVECKIKVRRRMRKKAVLL